jgi:hypothetical protein
VSPHLRPLWIAAWIVFLGVVFSSSPGGVKLIDLWCFPHRHVVQSSSPRGVFLIASGQKPLHCNMPWRPKQLLKSKVKQALLRWVEDPNNARTWRRALGQTWNDGADLAADTGFTLLASAA